MIQIRYCNYCYNLKLRFMHITGKDFVQDLICISSGKVKCEICDKIILEGQSYHLIVSKYEII